MEVKIIIKRLLSKVIQILTSLTWVGVIVTILYFVSDITYPKEITLPTFVEITPEYINLTPTLYPKPTISPINYFPTTSIPKQNIVNITPQDNTITDWGVAHQIGDDAYRMNIQMDAKMGTPQEVFVALNNYRNIHGSSSLLWDDKLASYAQTRINEFDRILNSNHDAFNEFLRKEENFRSLGFWSLGENCSYGYVMQGVHLIEWIYGADKPHNDNQLNPTWSHVGIATSGKSTDIIFAGNKI